MQHIISVLFSDVRKACSPGKLTLSGLTEACYKHQMPSVSQFQLLCNFQWDGWKFPLRTSGSPYWIGPTSSFPKEKVYISWEGFILWVVPGISLNSSGLCLFPLSYSGLRDGACYTSDAVIYGISIPMRLSIPHPAHRLALLHLPTTDIVTSFLVVCDVHSLRSQTSTGT